jgi:hypothetical protein
MVIPSDKSRLTMVILSDKSRRLVRSIVMVQQVHENFVREEKGDSVVCFLFIRFLYFLVYFLGLI